MATLSNKYTLPNMTFPAHLHFNPCERRAFFYDGAVTTTTTVIHDDDNGRDSDYGNDDDDDFELGFGAILT